MHLDALFSMQYIECLSLQVQYSPDFWGLRREDARGDQDARTKGDRIPSRPSPWTLEVEEAPWSVAKWAVALRFDNPRAPVLVLVLG